MAQTFKILLVAAEVFPFAKTGGLADVTGSLPSALKRLGHSVRVLFPKYDACTQSQSLDSLGLKIEAPNTGGEEPCFKVNCMAISRFTLSIILLFLIVNIFIENREPNIAIMPNDFPFFAKQL